MSRGDSFDRTPGDVSCPRPIFITCWVFSCISAVPASISADVALLAFNASASVELLIFAVFCAYRHVWPAFTRLTA